MRNFDEKIRLGYSLTTLKEKRAQLVKIREKSPCAILLSFDLLNELHPIIGEAGNEVIKHSCEEVISVCIGSIDRQFEKLKAEFEQLIINPDKQDV